MATARSTLTVAMSLVSLAAMSRQLAVGQSTVLGDMSLAVIIASVWLPIVVSVVTNTATSANKIR
jgi:hypothetical protein